MSRSTDRKPIYDDDNEDLPIGIDLPRYKALESRFRTARQWLAGRVEVTVNKFDNVTNFLAHTEKRSVAAVSAATRGDTFLPGALYVVLSVMAGSILTRRRTLLLRTATPIMFGVGTAIYVLPETSKSIGSAIWKLEEEKMPAFARQHATVHASIARAWASAKSMLDKAEMRNSSLKEPLVQAESEPDNGFKKT